MGQYRKKPVVVEAWQWTPPEFANIPDWLCTAIEDSTCCCHQRGEDAGDMVVTINTLEGMMTANPGDWIIKGVKGELYPCKPDIFAATYDVAAVTAEAAAEISARGERLPDTSDIPETSEDWFAKAKLAGYAECSFCHMTMAHPCSDRVAAEQCSARPVEPQLPPGVRADAMQIRPGDPAWRAQSPPLASEDYNHPNQRATRFRDEIEQVINSHSRESGSDTPDFILAQFVLDVMDAFDRAVTRRSGWYKPPGPIYNRIAELEAQLQQAHDLVLRTEGENTQLRGELQRVSMAGMTPSMVVGK